MATEKLTRAYNHLAELAGLTAEEIDTHLSSVAGDDSAVAAQNDAMRRVLAHEVQRETGKKLIDIGDLINKKE